MRLRTIGPPTGFATIGVFDNSGNVKTVFGTIEVANALPLHMQTTDYPFSISNLANNSDHTS
jgi:hypothetical protein